MSPIESVLARRRREVRENGAILKLRGSELRCRVRTLVLPTYVRVSSASVGTCGARRAVRGLDVTLNESSSGRGLPCAVL